MVVVRQTEPVRISRARVVAPDREAPADDLATRLREQPREVRARRRRGHAFVVIAARAQPAREVRLRFDRAAARDAAAAEVAGEAVDALLDDRRALDRREPAADQ